jgi:Ca2+-transporting ATPase
VVTGALAIGTTRMARRNAIVKRLPAVETMGCTTVICTDKTGTLTKNEMTARRLYFDRRQIEVTGSGYEPQGQFLVAGEAVNPREVPVLELAARICILCNDAGLDDKDGVWSVRGDPTEGALVVLARKVGLEPERLSAEYPRVAEIPFSSETKRMSTIHHTPQGFLMCVKGAPEGLLPRCRHIATGDGERHLQEEDRDEIISQVARMAHDALRVLGLAYKGVEEVPDPDSEPDRDLVWVGLVGLIDPARDEAPEAVRRCHEAGIRVIMVTGDHPDTAGAIAREVGLVAKKKSPVVLTGTELNRLSDADLKKTLRTVRVFARVAPEHKLRLIGILKEQGEVVAMTGDGVNDAPALKRADIGVAMGITGTEVTKETAAMILADDNFATLVAAVEEGRAIFDNIKKYLVFLLSCNLAEILVLTSAIFIGLPLPLLALQILWVNLDSDGLPAFALGVDPKAPDIMRRPPRPAGEGVFTPAVNVLLAVISVYLCLILLPLFAYYVLMDPNRLGQSDRILAQAQTMVFVALILAEQVNAFNCRSDRHSLFTVGFFTNRLLLVSVTLSTSMLMAVLYWPPLASLFHTYPLDRGDWLIAAGLGLSIFPVVEMAKWIIRRQSRKRPLVTA